MKIEKAIEILTLMGTPEFDGHVEDILAARKLGIEALKVISTIRERNIINIHQLLPSETKK